MTLFFGQLFVTVFNNGNRVSVLGFTRGYDVTGGPNGITNVDPFNVVRAFDRRRCKRYFYTALVVFLLALFAVYLVDRSRTGRRVEVAPRGPARRGADGDAGQPAEARRVRVRRGDRRAHGHPVRGAEHGVFTADFDVPTLIIVYAMLILGGAGSLGGVILGALVVNVSLEVAADAGPRDLGLLHA